MIPFRTYFKTFFKASEPISELQNLFHNHNKKHPKAKGCFQQQQLNIKQFKQARTKRR
jgi:hypothetical protein